MFANPGAKKLVTILGGCGFTFFRANEPLQLQPASIRLLAWNAGDQTGMQ